MPIEPLKVHVVSTFQDLAPYRQAVADAIKQLGMIPTLGEQFAATPETPLEVIKNKVAQSDVLVLILGFRYGSIVSGTNKSWVEWEYESARSLNKPTLVFAVGKDTPWPVSAIDSDSKRITEFREKLSSTHTVKFFTSPSDLAASVAQSLTYYSLSRKEETIKEMKREVHNVRIIRLLLSSPGDVGEERFRVSLAVFRFNQESVEAKGLFIKLIRWEDMAPQIGPGTQTVINKQIEDYHLFVGIMWNRFGTPTDVAASGTQEEFNAAVNAWKTNRKPWITFYFCERPSNFTTAEQLEQKLKVVEFRKQLYDMGVVRSFVTPDEFEDLVYRDLLKITLLSEFNRLT